jgi:hypothetical protein
MGLTKSDLGELALLRKKYPDGLRCLFLGSCDFFLSNKECATLMGQAADHLGAPHDRLTLSGFGKSFGFDTVDSVDLAGHPTLTYDLHEPLPEHLKESYDWVIDGGVLFWCFDIPAVLRNVLFTAKSDAVLVHFNALSGFMGAGYYALQPKLFVDFYAKNKVKIETLGTRVHQRSPTFLDRVRNRLRFRNGAPGWVHFDPDAIFLNRVTSRTVILGSKEAETEPSSIPANTILMVIGKRQGNQALERPILLS